MDAVAGSVARITGRCTAASLITSGAEPREPIPAVEASQHTIAAVVITGRDEGRHNWPDWRLHAQFRAGNSTGGDPAGAQTGNVRGAQTGNVRGAQAGNVRGAQAGNVRGAQAGNVRGAQAGNVRGALAGNVRGAQAGNVSGAQAENGNPAIGSKSRAGPAMPPRRPTR